QIPRTELKIAIAVLGNLDQQRSLVDLQLVERLAEQLALRFLYVKCVDDGQLAVCQLRSQCRAQRPEQLLARKGVLVRARLWPVPCAAMTPQWRANRPDARPSGAFLLPKLLTRPGNTPAILGGMRAGPLTCAVVLHRFPQQVFIDRTKHLVGQIERADLRA